LAWQLDFIRTSLQICTGQQPYPIQINQAVGTQHAASAPDTKFFENAALNIAETLLQIAIHGQDGSITWLTPQNTGIHYQMRTPGTDLYAGYAGIALFFAALAKLNLHPDAETITRATLRPVQNALMQTGDGQINTGGTSGYGGLVYGLFTVGRFLQDNTLINTALTATLNFPDNHLLADKTLDVSGGVAGYLLMLLALYEYTHEKQLLTKMHLCADRLISQQADNGAWYGHSKIGLAGFSHGAAGITYALLRLYRITGDGALHDAALRGIAYETTLFVPEAGNWRDLREKQSDSDDENPFMTAWCHGATGIALSRMACLQFIDDMHLQNDATIALQTTATMLQQTASFSDHVCCGNAGRIEALLSAGQLMNTSQHIEKAHFAGQQMVNHAANNGGYRYAPGLPRGIITPGFFQGAAGIGYQLLRLVFPDELPSALLWQ
ncbi:MAG: type 2 lanthipeptide synthetase LanM, partial [Aggregatilineales bacterium]